MSTVEVVSPWMSSQVEIAQSPRPLGGAWPARRPAPLAPRRPTPGAGSLRQIVAAAVAQAEGEAIRRALVATRGNKSQAARLLRTNYTTLHGKMKRYGIPARPGGS
jgi:DNA-binding NtrC family response regulator